MRGCLKLDAGRRGSAEGDIQHRPEVANFIATIEHPQSIKIACLEEIGLAGGFIDRGGFEALVDTMPRSPYREYLESLLLDGP